MRALCLADGALAGSLRAAARDVADQIDFPRARGADGSYDLVIAAGVDTASLRDARRALAADGVLYAECLDARPLGARRVRRRVIGAGLGAVRVVAPWPSIATPDAWLPLEPTVAAGYYLRRHPIAARHPLRRVSVAARRHLAHAALAAGRARSLVVIARPEPTGSVAPWWVAASARAEGVSERGADWLLLTPGGAESRVLGARIDSGRTAPTSFVKLSRTPASATRMARAATVLESVRDAGLTARGFAPTLIARISDDDGTLIATVEEAIAGRWLGTTLHRRTLERTTEEVTTWLIDIANATLGPPRDDAWQRLLRPMVDRFRAACSRLVDPALLDGVEARLATIGPLPTVLEHRDFRPWNLYVTPGRMLTAFDWDMGRIDGLPGNDLLQCHAFLAFALDGSMRAHRFGESQRRAESSALGGVRRECLARYANAVGITDDTLRALRPFAWMALSEDQTLARRAAGAPLTRADVDRSFLSIWEYEARRALA